MKNLIKNLLILLFCLPLTLSAQLIDYGTYMRTDDQLTIGTNSDSYPFYVRKNDSSWQARFTNRDGDGADVYIAHGAGYGVNIKGRTTGGQYTLRLDNLSDLTNIFYNNGKVGLGLQGNVGIGTSAPSAKLDVRTTNSTIAQFIQSNVSNTNAKIIIRGSRNACPGCNVAYIDFEDYDSNEGSGTVFTLARVSAGMETDSGKNGYLRFYTTQAGTPAERMRIKTNGNVGIGTSNPTYKLSVNGNIRAKEVRVETGWSDYVFYDDYQLPTLEEEEQHIEEKGYLLGFESEADMGGEVLLGDVSKRQQAKIEEMMLHLIEMNKKLKTNTELMKKIEEANLYIFQLNDTVKELQKQIEELKQQSGK